MSDAAADDTVSQVRLCLGGRVLSASSSPIPPTKWASPRRRLVDAAAAAVGVLSTGAAAEGDGFNSPPLLILLQGCDGRVLFLNY